MLYLIHHSPKLAGKCADIIFETGALAAADLLSRPMQISLRRLGTLAVVAMIIAACGGDDAEAGGGRTIDVCALVTQAEASSFLGGPADSPPTDSPGNNEATCGYESPGAQTRFLLQVYDGENFYSGDNTDLHPDAEPIGGLGEKGYLEPGGVGFVQNDWAVSVSRISGPVSDDTLLAVARRVSERLP